MDAYGGIQLDHEVLERLAEALRAGRLPMILQHDPTRPLSARIVDAGIGDDGEGYEQVWVRFEIEEEAWNAVQDEWRRAGAPGGFSWSGSVPLRFIPAEGDAPKPTVAIAADAHFWTDEQIVDAATKLSTHANVHAAQRLAFAHVPDPVVVITLYEIARDIFADALWDTLKGFLTRQPAVDSSAPDQTIFEFRISEGGRNIIGRVATNDAGVLHHAIDALGELGAERSQAATWNDTTDCWESPPVLPPAPLGD